MAELLGRERAMLLRALVDAFPTLDRLEQLASLRLDLNLETVVARADLATAVFRLIAWADEHGRIRELVTAARDENPGNPLLADAAPGILRALDDRSGLRRARLVSERIVGSSIAFGVSWTLVLAAVPIAAVVRVPATVTASLDTNLVAMRIAGGDGTRATLLSGVPLAWLTMQDVARVDVISPVVAELRASPGPAAVTAQGIADLALVVPGGSRLEWSTDAGEPGLLKLASRDGAMAALFRAQRLDSIRCPRCAGADVVRLSSVGSDGRPDTVRVTGAPTRAVLLLAVDVARAAQALSADPIALDVVDTLSFESVEDDRPVSRIRRGTLTVAGAAPVALDGTTRLTLGHIRGGSLSLVAGPDLHVELSGSAGRLSLERGGVRQDLRPSALSAARAQPALLALVAAVLAVVTWPRIRPGVARVEARA